MIANQAKGKQKNEALAPTKKKNQLNTFLRANIIVSISRIFLLEKQKYYEPWKKKHKIDDKFDGIQS